MLEERYAKVSIKLAHSFFKAWFKNRSKSAMPILNGLY